MGRNWTRRSIEEIFDNLFKKYAKEGGASTGDVGIPCEYTSTGSVSIGQQAVTFWLTPEIKRTSSAPPKEHHELWLQTNGANGTTTDTDG